MVVEVEIRHDDSLLSLPTTTTTTLEDNNDNNVFVTIGGDQRESNEFSCCNDRDTSVTCRDSADNTRCQTTLNTYNSILNITEEDDDEDDDDEDNEKCEIRNGDGNDNVDDVFHSFLFDDISGFPLDQSFNNHQDGELGEPEVIVAAPDRDEVTPRIVADNDDVSQISSSSQLSQSSPTPTTANKDGRDSLLNHLINSSTSSLGAVTESFVESLCVPFVDATTTTSNRGNTTTCTAAAAANVGESSNNCPNVTSFQNINCLVASDSACLVDTNKTKDVATKLMQQVNHRRVLLADLFDFLSYAEPPSQEELDEVWLAATEMFCSDACIKPLIQEKQPQQQQQQQQQFQKHQLPSLRHRISTRERTLRIHRLYLERMLPRRTTRNGTRGAAFCIPSSFSSSPSPKSVIYRAKSMDDSMMDRRRNEGVSNRNSTSLVMEDTFNNMFPPIFGDGKEDPLEAIIGKGLDPILPARHDMDHSMNNDNDDGYDSDPGELSFWTTTADDSRYYSFSNDRAASLAPTASSSSSSRSSRSSANNIHIEEHPWPLFVGPLDRLYATDDETICAIVQETLNCTWTLTYHPISANVQSPLGQKPICISVWFERGTLIHNNAVMLEPCLQWKEIYHPQQRQNQSQHQHQKQPLHNNNSSNNSNNQRQQRKVSNISTETPFSIRVMDLCRIVEASNDMGSNYPLARTSCCFSIKSYMEEEYLFEAASVKERNDIIQRWKITVARLATLAVTEDLETLQDEFFIPILS